MSDLLDEVMVRIKPFRGEDLEPLKAAAALDGGGVMFPTDVVWKKGERVGYLGVFPLCWMWLSKTKLSNREVLEVLNAVDNTFQHNRVPGFASLIHADSRLLPTLLKCGHIDLGEHKFLIKTLNQ